MDSSIEHSIPKMHLEVPLQSDGNNSESDSPQSTSFSKVTRSFNGMMMEHESRIQILKDIISFRSYRGEISVSSSVDGNTCILPKISLDYLSERIEGMEERLSTLEAFVNIEKQHIEKLDGFHKNLLSQEDRCKGLLKNLSIADQNELFTCINTSASSSTIPANDSTKSVCLVKTPASSSRNSNNSTIQEGHHPLEKRIRPHLCIPSITLTTSSELETVPRYVKGRLTVKQVNDSIEEFQAILNAKYTILAKQISKMGEKTLQMYKAYKELEDENTKGFHFLSENDIRAQSVHFKHVSTAKFLIATLRYLKRLKELPGQTKKWIVLVS